MGHGGRVNDGNGGERVGRGEEGSGADPGERRRGRGSERGEWERGPRGRGPLAPLSSPASVPARGSGGSAPLFRPGRGNREGDAGGRVGWGDWAGGVRGWRPSLGRGAVGERAFSFFFFFCSVLFFVFLLFVYFLFCFISFKVFRHFIKRSFLHHNCQCII